MRMDKTFKIALMHAVKNIPNATGDVGQKYFALTCKVDQSTISRILKKDEGSPIDDDVWDNIVMNLTNACFKKTEFKSKEDWLKNRCNTIIVETESPQKLSSKEIILLRHFRFLRNKYQQSVLYDVSRIVQEQNDEDKKKIFDLGEEQENAEDDHDHQLTVAEAIKERDGDIPKKKVYTSL